MVRDPAHVPPPARGDQGGMGMPANRAGGLSPRRNHDRLRPKSDTQTLIARPANRRRQEMTAPSTPENVSVHLRDLRGKPHAEVVIIKRDTEGPGAVGICYNTLSLPDHLSDEQFRALDPDALKAEFDGDGIWMNGPRRAQMDEASAEVLDGGRVTSLGGIPMQTVAKVRIPDVRMFAG